MVRRGSHDEQKGFTSEAPGNHAQVQLRSHLVVLFLTVQPCPPSDVDSKIVRQLDLLGVSKTPRQRTAGLDASNHRPKVGRDSKALLCDGFSLY